MKSQIRLALSKTKQKNETQKHKHTIGEVPFQI